MRRASRAAFVLAAVFALLDLWQVAILRPGFLSAASVLLLLAMYLGAAFVAVMALLAAAMLRRGRDVGTAAGNPGARRTSGSARADRRGGKRPRRG